MRRIKIAQDTSALDQVCEDYRAFRRSHPHRYSRVPEKIKASAKSLLESGMTRADLASKLGVNYGTLNAWMKSQDFEPAPKAKVSGTEAVESKLAEIKSAYSNLRSTMSLAPAMKREHTKTLGRMSDELIVLGACVEQIAAAAGVSHLTVRMWLKSIKDVHVAVTDENDATEEQKAPIRTNVAQENKSIRVDTLSSNTAAAAAELPEKAAATTPTKEEAVETRESEAASEGTASGLSQESTNRPIMSEAVTDRKVVPAKYAADAFALYP